MIGNVGKRKRRGVREEMGATRYEVAGIARLSPAALEAGDSS